MHCIAGDDSLVTLPLTLAGVPLEWLAWPKQAVFAVPRARAAIYAVVTVTKVLFSVPTR